MDYKNLFTTKFLFQIDRVMLSRADNIFLTVGLCLTVLAIVFKLAALYAPNPVDAKFRGKFYSLFLTIGLSEIVWFGFRYQNVNFFGSHFVAMLMLVIGVLWFGWIAIKMFRHYGREKTDWDKEQVKLKYLPK